jgi:hypothetical protein
MICAERGRAVAFLVALLLSFSVIGGTLGMLEVAGGTPPAHSLLF